MPPECVVCGAETTVSDACTHCGRPCCLDHRPPERHDCPGTDAGTTTGWRPDLDARADATGMEARPSLFRPGIGLGIGAALLVVVALLVVAWVGPVGGVDAGSLEDHITDRTDEERLDADVGATVHDSDLATVARIHSHDMRERGFVNHTNPDGKTPRDRIRAVGLDCQPGENIYHAPHGTLASSERALAEHVVASWLDSPGHRETLLRERYDRQGVGVAVGTDGVYVTQLFC